MKLLNWNVNGLRAFTKKGKLDWVQEQEADLVTFQEIKGRPEQFALEHKFFNAYRPYWNPAQRPGYSGVATFSRLPKTDNKSGMDNPTFDHEGRIIQTNIGDIVLFNIYFPNGQRGQDRVQYKIAFYEALMTYIKTKFKGRQIILTGDFNTAHREIDLANPDENRETSGFLPEERQALENYLNNGFIDVFRYFNPNSVKYTWWTYRFGARFRNIGWRIDYFLVSEDLINQVNDIQICDDIEGSDHCPIIMDINI